MQPSAISVRPSPLPSDRRRRRTGRAYVRFLFFLLTFTLVLLVVTKLYLLPAYEAAKHATDAERRQLGVYGSLMLAVVLFVLFAGILLTFRIGRYFFPRPPTARSKPTEYVDAWAESARRMQVPPEE